VAGAVIGIDRDGTLVLFARERNHVALEQAVGSDKTLHGYSRE
jgi:hypothetical protein